MTITNTNFLIDSIEDLENYCEITDNRRLKSVIKRFKYSDRLDEQILALASIIQALRRKNIQYTQHFIQQCLLYLLNPPQPKQTQP